MVYIARWKITLICLVCILGVFYSLPNLIGASASQWMRDNLPSWAPSKTVNLGLDLQGGAHLLFAVDVNSVIREQEDALLSSARATLRENKIAYRKIERERDASGVAQIHIRLRDPDGGEEARRTLRRMDDRAEVTSFDDDAGLEVIRIAFTPVSLREISNQTIAQSIEVIRRRIDETGTREPVIQRQGDDRILVQLPGVDDPAKIKELIGTTAKLTFHLVQSQLGGPDGQTSQNSDRRGRGLTLPSAEFPGREYRVARKATLTGDMLTNAAPSFSQGGQPVVTFSLNSIGSRRFCRLTKEHTNRPFAIVLDGEVISAPNINEPICGGSAQISGNFTVQETSDLALLLRAGALPADLTILEERTVGPSLGKDSVEAGRLASMVGLALVLAFMVLSYRLFGLFANVALVMNVGLILALLSGLQATLTLPGIAGIVLTIGMAVDANVLIFERIREELRAGRSVINAVDAGYSRAMATIIDSNLTTLIAAIILYSFGSGPIKGFAVTLGIGIMTSFFSAIMVTRAMVVVWLRRARPSSLPI